MGCGATAAKKGGAGGKYTELPDTHADPGQAKGVVSYRSRSQGALASPSPAAATLVATEEEAGKVGSSAVAASDAEAGEAWATCAEQAEWSPAPMRAEEEAAPGAQGPALLPCWWWACHAEWIRQRATEILAAYNYFFEHIGLRKGWRTAPFAREEVQVPFQAAAEVVTVVRARLDEQKDGLVLRQLEGSAMNFLWGWSPGRPPGSSPEALEEFFRGLVFATLSDGHGLVEGLDSQTVEHYVSCHPLIAPGARATGGSQSATSGTAAAFPTSPLAARAAADSDSDTSETDLDAAEETVDGSRVPLRALD